MKKLFAVVALLLVVWLGYRALVPGGDATPGNLPSQALGATSARAASAETAVPPSAPLPRVPVLEPLPRAPSALGDLLVHLTWKDDGGPATEVGVDAICRSDPGPRNAFRHAVSDTRGTAAFPGLFAGKVLLKTTLGHRFDVEIEPGVERTLDLALEPFDLVDGLVVAADGAPVGGAVIWTSSSARFWPGGQPIAVAGPDGRFRLRGLNAEATVGARARGHRPSLTFESGDLPAGPGGARTVILQLGPPGGQLAGVVRGPGGRPVPGALVQAGPRGGHIVDLPSGLRGTAPVPVPVESDAAGGFSYPNDLDPGAQPVHVLAGGFPLWSGTVDVVVGEHAFLEVQLDRPARIVGRVVLPDGTPVPGATVTRATETGGGWYHDAFPPSRDTSREDGTFVLEWVAPGEQEVNASVSGYARLGRARATVPCIAGETSEAELVLELGRTIRGRVVDVDGAPLVGWGVYGEPALRGMVYPRQDRTDDDGRFLLANLGDCAWQLRVAAPGEFPHPPRAEVQGVPTGATDVEIVVTKTGTAASTLRGRLLGADGRVPRDVRVTVWPEAGDSGSFANLDHETGAFEHEVHLPGRYQVRVLRGGQTVASSEVVDLLADQVTDVGLMRLEEMGSVAVTLRGVPEAELDQVLVVLDADSAATAECRRKGDTFLSQDVAPGRWVVRVHGGRRFVPDREVDVRSGQATEIDLDAEAGFEVDLAMRFARADWSATTVDIRDEGGVLLRRGGPWPRARMTADELRFHGLTLPAGRCTVEARTDDGQRAVATIEVGPAAGARGPYRLDLR